MQILLVNYWLPVVLGTKIFLSRQREGISDIFSLFWYQDRRICHNIWAKLWHESWRRLQCIDMILKIVFPHFGKVSWCFYCFKYKSKTIETQSAYHYFIRMSYNTFIYYIGGENFEQLFRFSTQPAATYFHMGSKTRRATGRSAVSTQRRRFPVGELARRKRELQESYLSKSKELNALRKKNKRLKEKVCIHLECFMIIVAIHWRVGNNNRSPWVWFLGEKYKLHTLRNRITD